MDSGPPNGGKKQTNKRQKNTHGDFDYWPPNRGKPFNRSTVLSLLQLVVWYLPVGDLYPWGHAVSRDTHRPAAGLPQWRASHGTATELPSGDIYYHERLLAKGTRPTTHIYSLQREDWQDTWATCFRGGASLFFPFHFVLLYCIAFSAGALVSSLLSSSLARLVGRIEKTSLKAPAGRMHIVCSEYNIF